MSTPAVEIRSFIATIPAGTPVASPVTVDIFFPARVVNEIHWRVPVGPALLMGWKLTMSGGQNVIPANGSYIVADDRADVWVLTNHPDSGQWEVTGYNTDIYDHSVHLDFYLSIAGLPDSTLVFHPNAALSAASSAAVSSG